MKLNALVVGFGYWGPNLVRNIHQSPNYNLVGVIETDEERAAIASAKYGVPVFSKVDLFPTLNMVDIVFIATKPASHFELAQHFIQQGKNIVLPKPVTTSAEDAKKLLDQAFKLNVNVFCDYTYFYSDNFKFMNSWIRENEFLHYTSYRCSLGILQSDVDVIADLASHDFSMLYKLTGEVPYEIYSLDTSHETYYGNSTSATVFAKWKNGLTADINVSWNAPKKIRKVTLNGAKSSLLIDETNLLQQLSVVEFSKNEGPESLSNLSYRRNTSFTLGEEKFINLERTESLATEIETLYSNIIGETKMEDTFTLSDSVKVWEYISVAHENKSGVSNDSI
jgi:predicted dehydrogenase